MHNNNNKSGSKNFHNLLRSRFVIVFFLIFSIFSFQHHLSRNSLYSQLFSQLAYSQTTDSFYLVDDFEDGIIDPFKWTPYGEVREIDPEGAPLRELQITATDKVEGSVFGACFNQLASATKTYFIEVDVAVRSYAWGTEVPPQERVGDAVGPIFFFGLYNPVFAGNVTLQIVPAHAGSPNAVFYFWTSSSSSSSMMQPVYRGSSSARIRFEYTLNEITLFINGEKRATLPYVVTNSDKFTFWAKNRAGSNEGSFSIVALDNFRSNMRLCLPGVPLDPNAPPPPSLTSEVVPPQAKDKSPNENDDYCIETTPVGSEVEVQSGILTLEHTLPSVKILNSPFSLSLAYNSQQANPSYLISTAIDHPNTLAVPQKFNWELQLGDAAYTATFTQFMFQSQQQYMWDAKDTNGSSLPTGIYPYHLKLTNTYATQSFTLSPPPTPLANYVLVNNQRNSHFGAGWTLKSLQRIYPSPIDNNLGSLFVTVGNGQKSHYVEGGQITESPLASKLGSPSAVVVNPITNDIYIAATSTNAIYKISQSGTVSIFADKLKQPAGLTFDDNGNLYVSNSGDNTIIKITPDGKTKAFASGFNNPTALAFNSTNNYIYVANTDNNVISRVSQSGLVENLIYGLTKPSAIAFPANASNAGVASDTLFIAHQDILGNQVISKINLSDASFAPTTIADSELFKKLTSITFDKNDNLLVTDTASNKIFRITPNGFITLFSNELLSPTSVAVDNTGNIFAAAASLLPTQNPFANTDSGILQRFLNTTPTKQYFSLSGTSTKLVRNADGSFTKTLKDGLKFIFNPEGLHIATVDRNENKILYEYNSQNQLVKIINPMRKITTLNYGTNGLLKSITDHAGRTTTLSHDAAGNLTTIQNPDGTTKTFSYDSNHLITSRIDEGGNTVSYIYDSYGRMQTVKYPDNTEKKFEPSQTKALLNSFVNTDTAPPASSLPVDIFYDRKGSSFVYQTNKFGNVVKKRDALYPRRITTIERDENSNPIKITKPNGAITTNTYDINNNILSTTQEFNGIQKKTSYTYEPVFNRLTSITDPKGNITRFEYDNKGNIVRTTDALGNTTINTYNSNGLITSTTDALGRTTSYTYNSDGNLTSITDAAGGVATYNYDYAGNIISITNPEGRTTHFEYNIMNRLIKTAAPDGNITLVTYNPNGAIASVIDPLQRKTTFEYDSEARLTKTTNSLNDTQTFSYDPNGNLIASIDQLNRTINYGYDQADRLIATLFQEGELFSYQYDEMDNIIAGTNPNSKVTQYQYDGLGHLTKTISPLGAQTIYTYDLNDNTESITDANSHSTSYKYDALNRRIEERNHLAGTKIYSYDKVGNLTSLKDENNNTTTYEYNTLNRLIKTTDALGNIYTKTYNKVGNLLTNTDPLERTTSYEYDSLNRLILTINALNNRTSYQYDTVGNLIATTNAKNKTTNYEYDALNRLAKITDSLGYSKEFSYAAVGNLISYKNATGHETTYQYDHLNRLVLENMPEEKSNVYTYDKLGNNISIRDSNGKITNFEYDDDNRQSKTINPLGHTATYSYDAVGNLFSTTDAKGNVSKKFYDELNRLVKEITPDTAETTYQYDAVGNLMKTINAEGSETLNKYDSLYRLLETTNALGGKESFAYDKVGNQISRTDENGVASTFAYDTLNRLTASYLPEGVIVSYEYDELGNQTKITNGIGKNTNYIYDDLGRLVSETNPAGQTKSYTYDGEGNILSLTLPDGQTVHFEYDALGRQTKKILPDGDSKNFSYDKLDNLQTVSDNDSRVDFTYDDAGRVVQTKTYSIGSDIRIQQPATTLSYSYDDNDNLVSLTTSDGKALTYAYDTQDRLTNISAGSGLQPEPINPVDSSFPSSVGSSFPTRTSFTYNKVGLMTNKTINNLLDTQYSYDPLSRITGIKTLSPLAISQSAISDLTYTYDPAGNRLSMTQTAGSRPSTHNYTYDHLYQLTSAQHSSTGVPPVPNDSNGLNYNESYSYDKNYNRVSSHLSSNYVYDDTDRLLEDDNFTYTYDVNGNLIEKNCRAGFPYPAVSPSPTVPEKSPLERGFRGVLPCERMVFSYDTENKLIQAQRYLNNSATATLTLTAKYYYDALGRRIAKQVNSVVTKYIYNGDNILEEYICAPEPSTPPWKCRPAADYIHTNAIDTPMCMNRASESFYFNTDALGTVTQMTNKNGQVIQQYTYDSFGNIILEEGIGVSNPYTYTAREFDEETGLYFYRNRVYDPTIGRFLQQDPVWETNLYDYVDNAPTNYTDPFGLYKKPYECLEEYQGSYTCLPQREKEEEDACKDDNITGVARTYTTKSGEKICVCASWLDEKGKLLPPQERDKNSGWAITLYYRGDLLIKLYSEFYSNKGTCQTVLRAKRRETPGWCPDCKCRLFCGVKTKPKPWEPKLPTKKHPNVTFNLTPQQFGQITTGVEGTTIDCLKFNALQRNLSELNKLEEMCCEEGQYYNCDTICAKYPDLCQACKDGTMREKLKEVRGKIEKELEEVGNKCEREDVPPPKTCESICQKFTTPGSYMNCMIETNCMKDPNPPKGIGCFIDCMGIPVGQIKSNAIIWAAIKTALKFGLTKAAQTISIGGNVYTVGQILVCSTKCGL